MTILTVPISITLSSYPRFYELRNVSVSYTKMVVHCRILQATVSKSIKPVVTSKLQRKMTKDEEKVHVFLTKADIFT